MNAAAMSKIEQAIARAQHVQVLALKATAASVIHRKRLMMRQKSQLTMNVQRNSFRRRNPEIFDETYEIQLRP